MSPIVSKNGRRAQKCSAIETNIFRYWTHCCLPFELSRLLSFWRTQTTKCLERTEGEINLTLFFTGKSLSEALIFASTNPQYDNRLFIELHVQYIKIPSSKLGRTCCVQKLFLTFRTIFVHNMF